MALKPQLSQKWSNLAIQYKCIESNIQNHILNIYFLGVILPHDTFGDHLDSNGKTVDYELEKKNFFAAAETLSEIWSSTVIDGHAVDCRALPVGLEHVPSPPDPKWVANHVQQTRYSLQIVKCDNRDCCEPFVTDWLTVFPDRFVPFPSVYTPGISGLGPVEPAEYIKRPKEYEFAPLSKRLLLKKRPVEAAKYEIVPFDLFCPSMQGKLEPGICPECKSYWPSAAAMLRHKKCHGRKPRGRRRQPAHVDEESDVDDESDFDEDDEADEVEEETEDDEVDEETEDDEVEEEAEDEDIPIFENIFEILQSPFVEEE